MSDNTEDTWVFNYGDKIEYLDCTRDLHFEAARRWAMDHGVSFEEDESLRTHKIVQEEYTEMETKTKKVIVPAVTHEEEVEETDEEGNVVKKTITVVDSEEHEEEQMSEEEVTKTRDVDQLWRYWFIGTLPEPANEDEEESGN